ncbi:MAG: MFS transporter, partial [Candidatus Competibacteraceae bacterium]|nr:MFS transporter [Candidatus Competibacteraceae bacterium]
GLDKQAAANLFSITALSMVIFMPVHGRLLDRLPTHWMFAWALLLTAASMVSIIFVDSIAMAMAYGVLFGMNNAALHTVISYVWPRYFGRKHLGSIQGAAQTIGVVGASIGPIPFGIAFDLFGSYSGALLIFALQPLLLAVLVLLVRAPDLKAAGQPD